VAVGQTASLPRGVRLARAAISPRTLLFLAGLLLLAVAPFFLSFHYKDLVIQAFIFAVLAISFDLLWG